MKEYAKTWRHGCHVQSFGMQKIWVNWEGSIGWRDCGWFQTARNEHCGWFETATHNLYFNFCINTCDQTLVIRKLCWIDWSHWYLSVLLKCTSWKFTLICKVIILIIYLWHWWSYDGYIRSLHPWRTLCSKAPVKLLILNFSGYLLLFVLCPCSHQIYQPTS